MKVSKVLLVLSLVIGLVFMAGSVKAAESAMESIPGGACVVPIQASAAGLGTVINLQNVAGVEDMVTSTVAPAPTPSTPVTPSTPAILVHAKIFDRDTNYISSFNVPLSPRDNVGLIITGDGTMIYIQSVGPEHFYIFGSPNATYTAGLAAGSDGIQLGYISFAITACDDAVICGGNGNGDPTDDPNATNTFTFLPNWLMVRYALVDTVTQSHADINAIMLQWFANLPRINEGIGVVPTSFIDTVRAPNEWIPYDWNGDGDWNDSFTGKDSADGIAIDPWELYITIQDPFAGGVACGLPAADPICVVADDIDLDCVGENLYPALGSVNGSYWGRWNDDPSLPVTTSLYTLFPASSGFFATISGPQGNRHMHLLVYDDDENKYDDDLTPSELAIIPFDGISIVLPPKCTTCTPPLGLAGDLHIQLDGLSGLQSPALLNYGGRIANMFGFTLVDWAGWMSRYPLVRSAVACIPYMWSGVDNSPATGSDVMPIPY